MDIKALQDAVKAEIDAATIPLLEVSAGWPDALSIPVGGALCVVALNDEVSIEYGQTFGDDSALVHLELHVLVTLSGAGATHAQAVLGPFISNSGASSILHALRSDPQLNGSVRYAKPLARVRGYGEQTIGAGLTFLGAILDLEVLVA